MLAGVPASPAAFALAFVGVAQVSREMLWRLRRPRKSRGKCFGVCAGCASPTENALAFAQAAQVPRHLPRRLRRLRKSRGECFGVCAGRASTTAFTETFAQVAQVPREILECLPGTRKRQPVFRGTLRGWGGDTKKPERTLFSAYHSGLTSAHLTKPTDGQRNGNYQLISYSVVSSTTVASVAPDFLRERRVRPEPLRPPAAVLSMLVL